MAASNAGIRAIGGQVWASRAARVPRAATSDNQQSWMPLAADLKCPRRLRYLYWGRAATGVLESKFSSAGPDYPGHVMYLKQRRVATNNPGIQIYCHLGLGTQSGLVIKGGKNRNQHTGTQAIAIRLMHPR